MVEWEAICRQCGRCCFEKWIEGEGSIRFTRIPCRHLDVVTRACRVYDKRLEVGEGCVRLTPENVPTFHWLPASCAYVEFLGGAPPGTPKRRKGSRHNR